MDILILFENVWFFAKMYGSFLEVVFLPLIGGGFAWILEYTFQCGILSHELSFCKGFCLKLYKVVLGN